MSTNEAELNPPTPSREQTELSRLGRHVLGLLQEALYALESPDTTNLLRKLQRRSGSLDPIDLGPVVEAVEEAVRQLQLAEAEGREAGEAAPVVTDLDELPSIPQRLRRFLAERRKAPGFTYTVHQDLQRGWVVTWKEYTANGDLRGSGRLAERPYAWIDD